MVGQVGPADRKDFTRILFPFEDRPDRSMMLAGWGKPACDRRDKVPHFKVAMRISTGKEEEGGLKSEGTHRKWTGTR